METAFTARNAPAAPRVGLFSIGLDAYWPQFAGLEDRLNGYSNRIARKLEALGAEVVHLGMIDNPRKAAQAGHRFRQADVDLIFLHIATYALSSTVLPVVRRARAPVVILNLAPAPAIDYDAFNRSGDRTKMTGEWLAFCQACSAPEIANVFSRCRIPFFQVTGLLEDDAVAWREIEEWVAAVRVAAVMEHNCLGIMGHYYGGMLDIYSDLTLQCACFGGRVEMIEVDELAALRENVTGEQIVQRVERFHATFDVQPDCSPEELARAARTSVALDRLASDHGLGSLAYFYSGAAGSANADAIGSIILGASLLTALGIPVAGEMEVKNVQAMKIVDAFGAGGSFTEFYAVDFKDDVVLMGHDGPGHTGIAEGRTKVRPLGVYHGKTGSGLSVEMSVRHGPVTMLSVAEGAGRLKLLYAEGESVPGPILEIGNTNSRYRFPLGARGFIDEWSKHGPAHHCAAGAGRLGAKLEKLGGLLGMECTRIC
jgi:L-arabinose isomerase